MVFALLVGAITKFFEPPTGFRVLSWSVGTMAKWPHRSIVTEKEIGPVFISVCEVRNFAECHACSPLQSHSPLPILPPPPSRLPLASVMHIPPPTALSLHLRTTSTNTPYPPSPLILLRQLQFEFAADQLGLPCDGDGDGDGDGERESARARVNPARPALLP